MTIWVVSDTHFGHANIITLAPRPFASAAEMDETMVERWNAVVKPSDHVYHLGDVAFKKSSLAQVTRLHGHKRLVGGNHDIFELKAYLAVGFEKVVGCRVLDGLLLTHIPVHPGSLMRFKANVHGHVHAAPALAGKYLNVCVEATDYTPVTLESLAQRALDLGER